ncbi:MAG: NlpC/P60 family protein [Tannerellaceae bacterium]|nr:NlpC/P60 family protein [Tannerellaceae bacterium]
MSKKIRYLFFLTFILVTCTSCGSSRRSQQAISSTTDISRRLGISVNTKDNLRLYTEAASWVGIPYKYGGNTRKGTDCSGFAGILYKEVYNKTLSRSTSDILAKNCHKVSKGKLKEGDLVFFNTTGKKKKTASHVGVYLKDGKFIHASTSKGVMVNSLSEPYYAHRWLTGGRVK